MILLSKIIYNSLIIDTSYYIIKNTYRVSFYIIKNIYNYYNVNSDLINNNEEIKLLKQEIIDLKKDIEIIKNN